MTLGSLLAGVEGAGGGGAFAPQARRMRVIPSVARDTTASFLMLDLDHILLLPFARDEVVLLRVVAERSKRHAQQLGRLRLHAAGALERFHHEDFSDRLEVVL